MNQKNTTQYKSLKVEIKKANTIVIIIIGIVIALSFFLFLPHNIKSTNNKIDKNSLTFPIHGMFYYPWFPETWVDKNINPFTHYHPTLGYYSSSAFQYPGLIVKL